MPQAGSATVSDAVGCTQSTIAEMSARGVKYCPAPLLTSSAPLASSSSYASPLMSTPVADPACGTGGFLLEAYRHATSGRLTPEDRERLRSGFVRGTELVDGTARLAAMNMVLHGIVQPGDDSPIEVRDALLRADGHHPSVVLANPPFGRKSSITMVGADGREAREDTEVARPDFWVTTSNKQLNFVQHIAQMLAINGRAAVVLPDNVLFEGGAGETVRRRLLTEFDVHTLLRLPTGIFYAGGVKANVLFFDKRPARPGSPWTTDLWVYDLRTNSHFTQKQNPLRRHHLDEFVECYRPGEARSARTERERFKRYGYDELVARDKANLDLVWLRDASLEDADSLPPPEVLAREIVDDLEAALAEFTAVAEALEKAAAERGTSADGVTERSPHEQDVDAR